MGEGLGGGGGGGGGDGGVVRGGAVYGMVRSGMVGMVGRIVGRAGEESGIFFSWIRQRWRCNERKR